eukprot:EG_transcript_7000
MAEGALEMPSLLPNADHPALLACLPVDAEYCQVAAALTAGRALAYVVGDVARPSLAVVEDPCVPDEAFIFGKSPYAIVRCLTALWPVWWPRLNVARGMERQLCRLLRKTFEATEPVAVKVAIYVLPPPPRAVTKLLRATDSPIAHLRPVVRPLRPADEPLLAAAPHLLRGRPPRDVATTICVGAVEDGALVCVAHLTAVWHRYGALAVATDAAYQRQGFATACLALAAQLMVAKGVLPVFPCREDNWPAVRLAHRLGFRELTTRVDIDLKRNPAPEDANSVVPDSVPGACASPSPAQATPMDPNQAPAAAEQLQSGGPPLGGVGPRDGMPAPGDRSGCDDDSDDSDVESDGAAPEEAEEAPRIPVEELLRVARIVTIALPTPDLQAAVGFAPAPQGDYDTNDDQRLSLARHLFLHFDVDSDMTLVRYLLQQEVRHTQLLRFPTETVRLLSLLAFEHGGVRDLPTLCGLHRAFPAEFEANYLCGVGRRAAARFLDAIGEVEAAEALWADPELDYLGAWHSATRRELHGLALGAAADRPPATPDDALRCTPLPDPP